MYATIADYTELFPNNPVADELSLMLASEKIDSVTFNRITGMGLNKLTPFQQEKLKMATCLQAKYLIEGAGDSTDGIASYSVLDISITLDKESARQDIERSLGMSYDAYDLIKKTGLTNRSFRGWR